MIVVDGRTDREKLSELLASPEETHLEFKSRLDLTAKEDQLKLVNDIVAMANRPPGGYILIGVTDDGRPALAAGELGDRTRFDGARVGDLVRKYVEGEVHVVTQVHEVEGHEIALLYVPHHRDGLPVPMSALGQYTKADGRQKVVFREGDVLVREGARNVPLRHAHWNDLLRDRDKRIRDEARAEVDQLIAQVTAAFRTGDATGSKASPLAPGMADDVFAEAVVTHLESTSDVRLRQFVRQAEATTLSPDERAIMIDKVAIVAVQAMYFERHDIAAQAIETLQRFYGTLKPHEVTTGLDLITYAYVLGSLAVRLRQWQHVRALALRPHTTSGTSYTYSSWIRHGQVAASRAGLFPSGHHAMMISRARDLMSDRPDLRPDVTSAAIPDAGQLANNDALLNSLCQFDVLYCVVVAAGGTEEAAGYPASAALDQDRANPAFEAVARDPEVRQELFATEDDTAIATALEEVFELAQRESFGFGGRWWSLPPIAERFVADHPAAHP